MDDPQIGSDLGSRRSAAPLPFSIDELVALTSPHPLPLVINGDRVLLGVNSFAPGDVFDSHIHETSAETFIGISGYVELWLRQRKRVVIEPGTVITVPSGVDHYLRNVTEETSLIGYVKVPYLPEDRILTHWSPTKGHAQ